MSTVLFTENDIQILNANPNVLRASEKAITYTDEFKRHFIEEYLKGQKTPRIIFEEAGFSIEMLRMKRCKKATERWLKAYDKDGIVGLRDTRISNSGRTRIKELSQEQIIMRQEAKIKLLESQVELLKKADKIERRLVNQNIGLPASEIFKLIKNTVQNHGLQGMVSYFCTLLNVSRSGYYNYLNNSETREIKESEDLKAKNLILSAMNKNGYKKGSRSILMTLRNEFGITMNRKKIQRIMRKYQIICPIRKANPYRRMAKATKDHSVVPNLLNREFRQGAPGKVLLTDITYLPYNDSNIAYLSTVKDASTNEILSYHLSERITLDIATTTIAKLVKSHEKLLHTEAFIHSDQGVHYTSPKFQKLLKGYGIGQSMSRRGNCWDNAPQESFFGHMKDEVDYRNCKTFGELQYAIDNYMNYYNHYRCQWGLKKLTPIQYRNQLLVG